MVYYKMAAPFFVWCPRISQIPRIEKLFSLQAKRQSRATALLKNGEAV
jgi:hypothetical protein